VIVLIERRDLLDGARVEAAVCVVGSGAAGTSLVIALAQAGIDVVVLEAGGRRPGRTDVDALVGDLSAAPEHDPLECVRQRRLGGTTAQWGGRCLPLDAVDFETRSWVPGSGWPVSRSDLMPWYRGAADLLRLGAFEWTVADALPDAAPFLLDGRDGSLLTDDMLWRWSPPVRFWPAFRKRLVAHPLVRVVQHAPVVRLEQAEAGGPVICAVVAAGQGRELRVRARHFVVAAGGLETARLLLCSDGLSRGGIGNSGDQVGRHYMIHPLAEVAEVRARPGVSVSGAADFATSRDGVYVRRMLRLSDDAQRRHQLRNAAFALWYPEPSDPAHGDGLLSCFALVRQALTKTGGFKATGVHRRYATNPATGDHLSNVARDLPGVSRYAAHWVRRRWLSARTLPSFTTLPRNGVYRLRFDGEQSPEPGNRVVLSSARDDDGMRRLEVHHRVGRDDRESLLRTLGLIATEVHRAGRADVVLPPPELFDDLVLGDGTHQMGTARMSATPRSGVVDADCRVHDSPNLFLAGSAVFPTSGMAGPTMTIVALSLRLAEQLRREVLGRSAVST